MQARLPFDDIAVNVVANVDVSMPPALALVPAPPAIQPEIVQPRIASDDAPYLVLFVKRARARRYIIRVMGDLSVRVTIPRRGSKRGAIAFLEHEQPWIQRQRQRMARLHADRLERAAHVIGDVSYEIAIRERAARERADRERAVQALPPRLLELAAVYGLTVRKISVRSQKWRWGSCSPNGHICLNWRLVTLPDDLRDYVLIHELMHLKRMDHSPAFWKLVEKACPDYRERRRRLRARDSA